MAKIKHVAFMRHSAPGAGICQILMSTCLLGLTRARGARYPPRHSRKRRFAQRFHGASAFTDQICRVAQACTMRRVMAGDGGEWGGAAAGDRISSRHRSRLASRRTTWTVSAAIWQKYPAVGVVRAHEQPTFASFQLHAIPAEAICSDPRAGRPGRVPWRVSN